MVASISKTEWTEDAAIYATVVCYTIVSQEESKWKEMVVERLDYNRNVFQLP